MFRRSAVIALFALANGAALGAQLRAPKAELTPSVVTARVRAGRPATLALKVVLPETIHVQSDKPREASYFPTALVLTPPAGVTVTATKYPAAVDFVQEGAEKPLAVFEKAFTVTVTVDLAASVKAGELVVPGRFDYQACDDKVCYRPVKADVQWTLTVVPS
jgi:hypothetical protein